MDLNLGDTQLIIKECARQGLSKAHTAYVLATAYWETAKTMKPVREAFWLSETWRKDNLRYYPWYGRGYVQLTWEKNYKEAGKKLNLDLTTNPDVVMKPETAVQILVRGCKEGWFTGKKLGDYTTYEAMRPMVNGDSKKVPKNETRTIAKIIADYAREYEKALPDAIKVEEGNTKFDIVSLLVKLVKLIFGAKK